jgi:hypothetical protein
MKGKRDEENLARRAESRMDVRKTGGRDRRR